MEESGEGLRSLDVDFLDPLEQSFFPIGLGFKLVVAEGGEKRHAFQGQFPRMHLYRGYIQKSHGLGPGLTSLSPSHLEAMIVGLAWPDLFQPEAGQAHHWIIYKMSACRDQ